MLNSIQGFQLSPQQKRLWLVQQASKVYHAQCAILLEGNLKVDVLKSALQQIINRHEILRTTFHRIPGIKLPIQVIASESCLSITEIDLSNPQVTEEAQTNQIASLLQQASQQSIEWEKGFLLQITLVRLLPNRHILTIDLPSLCADAKTLENVRQEISCAYGACLQGKELEDEPLQYADLSDWQNELLESEDTEVGRDYWRKLDISSLESLQLPFASKSEEKKEFVPQVFSISISTELTKKIAAIASNFHTPVSALLLTSWQVLLWRLSETSDVILGINGDNRNYEELKSALGLFVRYLPVHSYLEADEKFSDILARVKESLNQAYDKQQYFSWEEISTPKDNSQGLLFFPFCFEFESRLDKYSVGDVSFSLYKQYICTDQFQVKLSCISQGETLIAEFHYDRNLFLREDIQRLARQFETLLASVVENPSGAIAQFNILSPLEHQQLLVEFNNTQTASLPYQCIHHWFEKQAQLTPEHLAVVCENKQLTYQQLNQQANLLAHYLQQLGVKPEVLVGICVERSIEMVVGVLGILKAGGAYVPLDPTYPKERLAFILADTQIPILLTQQRLQQILSECSAELLCLDADWPKIAQESKENPVSSANIDNLAYVIYTSGSTGKPKGTLIPHRGLINYLSWCTQAYRVEEGEGTIVNSSLAFDLTITGLFSPLLVGRRVQLIPDNLVIESLSAALGKSDNLSLVKVTPAQLLLLSQQLSPSEAAGKTRAFIIGGENLLAESIAWWQNFAPETSLVNEYGPTETVVGCCIYQVPPGERQSGSVPIGRAIANTQLYILNQYLQPVPMGVVGELYIGGAGVARGYLNRPELTAEKFIPNPFNDESGTRLYKTGDLARYRADGNIEFLGRIDHQVKIRGFRIELGEIERVLSQYPGIRETVVMVREDVPGNQRLVAYIVFDVKSPFTTTELSQFLQEKLPEYMIPSAFVVLEALPLTANYKVDRKALPVPDELRPELAVAYIPPSTEIEKTIAAVWQEVLRLEKVGIHDNFFDIGGHSLLVAQVHNQLRELLQPDLSMMQLLEYPTIHSLAKYLNQTENSELELQLVQDRTEKQKAAINRQKELRRSK